MSNETMKLALTTVRDRMAQATARRMGVGPDHPVPRLVAVSKFKPKEDIITAYDFGERHFGENYVKELDEKSHLIDVPDIKWHFIGHLQTNKTNKVAQCPHLFMVETIDSLKLAAAMDKSWASLGQGEHHPLNILVQVNTSQEENKSGVDPQDTNSLVQSIRSGCSNLRFCGLMTIGSFDHDLNNGPNPDFIKLLEVRDEVCLKQGLPPDQVELSFGMSGDYEHAIELGSTNIRVGTTIFGSRN